MGNGQHRERFSGGMRVEDLLRYIKTNGFDFDADEAQLARIFLNEDSADRMHRILSRNGFDEFRHALQMEVFRQYNRIYDFVDERIYENVFKDLSPEFLLRLNLRIRRTVIERGDIDKVSDEIRRLLDFRYGNMTVDVVAERERRRRIEASSRRPPGGSPPEEV
jgi:hypothetical protein